MYLVSYKTATRPTDLPEGATVERIPREFPADMRVYGDRLIRVEKSVIHDAYLLVDRSSVHLKTEETRELAHALLELIGDPVPDSVPDDVPDTPVNPTVVRDGDGDHWVLNPRTGKWILTNSRTELNSMERNYNTGETLDVISRAYSGYTVIR